MGANISSGLEADRAAGEALNAIRRLVRTLRLNDVDVEQLTGVSSAQLFVLRQLAHSEANSINDLAARTLTDQSSVSAVVSRLAHRGLVERTPSPQDARRTTVSITPAGLQLLQRAPKTVQQRLTDALERLPHESLRTLAHELTQLVGLLGAAHEPPSFLFEDDATGAR